MPVNQTTLSTCHLKRVLLVSRTWAELAVMLDALLFPVCWHVQHLS